MQRNLSSFAGKLSKEAKTRYKREIGMIGGLDPFECCVERRLHQYRSQRPGSLFSLAKVLTMHHTIQDKEVFFYYQFLCDWVKDVRLLKVAGKFLTTGRVSSRHLLNDKLLQQSR